MFSSVHHQN